MSTYRAFWPVTVVRPMRQLVDEACEDLPRMLGLARVRLTGTPHWAILPAVDVPGSGRVTDWCLVVTAEATAAERPPDPPWPNPDGMRACKQCEQPFAPTGLEQCCSETCRQARINERKAESQRRSSQCPSCGLNKRPKSRLCNDCKRAMAA